MEPVRLGVIGLGGMGKAHVRNIRESDAATLVAFADVNVEAARDVAA